MTMAGSALMRSFATAAAIASKQRGSFVTKIAKRWRRRGSVKRTLISMPSDAARRCQTGAESGGVEILFRPGRLQRHAELAARDLFLERLDVGVLLEQKIRDARDHSGLVAPDDGDGGELFHTGSWRGIAHRRLKFFADSFSDFARRTGALDRLAPTQVRGISILRNQPLLLRGGINRDGEFFRQAYFHLVEIVPRLQLGGNVLPIENLIFRLSRRRERDSSRSAFTSLIVSSLVLAFGGGPLPMKYMNKSTALEASAP